MKDRSQVMLNVSTLEDINKLNDNIKYINLDITNPNIDVINYFLENGQDYYYTDLINNKSNYIYVPYEIFKQAEIFILNIVEKVNLDLDKIEKAKYLYIELGKNLGLDMSIMTENEEQYINTKNNIWKSICERKCTRISLTKIYLYLCRFLKIENNIIEENNEIKNELKIDGKTIITDIIKDLPNIQANFHTNYFTGYNLDKKIDKKIKYIENDYNEEKLRESLKNINFKDTIPTDNILLKIEKVIKIPEIKPLELSIILKMIFKEYYPNENIKIENYYINNKNKETFVIIQSYDKFYSYNYKQNRFLEINNQDIEDNLLNKKISVCTK